MKRRKRISILALPVLLFTIIWLGPATVLAHCDGMDGPVVKAAQKALEAGDVNLVLIWVQKKDEVEIKEAFKKTLSIRKLNPDAKEIADRYFFETLVRIHRAGEGAPYTGLKPAGRDLGPAIPAADRTLAEGKVGPLVKLIVDVAKNGIQERFKQVMAKKDFKSADIDAGREYVEAYVGYVHYVERLYEAAARPANGHYPESEETTAH